MKKPLISIIIVGFNAKRFLKACFDSLGKISYKNTQIIFVDNGSSDGSFDFVKRDYPHIILVRHKKNLGFAGGHGMAMQKAKGDAILLLNTDTIVEKNLLDELVKALYKSSDIGAVQPRLILYHNRKQIDSIGSFFLWSGFLYHFGCEKDSSLPIYNQPMEIFSVKGACMLIKSEVLKKTGLFDETYFTAFEDTDLSHRIWLAGYKIMYVPYTTVYHIGGGTNTKAIRAFVLFHSEKNRICTYIKNLSPKYLLRVLPITLLMEQLVFLEYLVRRRNIAAAFSVQKAIVWNILHIKETLRKRKFVQTKIRRVGDDEFLPKLIKPVRLSYYYYLPIGLNYYKD